MRATYIALWDAKGDRIDSILPNHPFVIEVGYQCEHSVRDFSVSIDIETIDGMRVDDAVERVHERQLSAQGSNGVRVVLRAGIAVEAGPLTR